MSVIVKASALGVGRMCRTQSASKKTISKNARITNNEFGLMDCIETRVLGLMLLRIVLDYIYVCEESFMSYEGCYRGRFREYWILGLG